MHQLPYPLDPLSVVLTGMAQLQGVVAGIVSPKANERYEATQPGVNSLPALLESGPEACFEFSDWLHSSRPALSDISDTSENLCEGVVKEAAEWYSEYLKTDILGRLSAKPTPSPFLKQKKWARVSRRIETMLIQAAPASVQEELNAARVSGLLPVVCRLYVIYGPGGLNEREIGLRQIQDPNPGTTVADTVEILRKWARWCARMTELGGTLPDCALRVKALGKITKVALQRNPETAFRMNLTTATLQVDTNPDDSKVQKLHAQMLGELEAICHRGGKGKG